jgi:hypothetical protein
MRPFPVLALALASVLGLGQARDVLTPLEVSSSNGALSLELTVGDSRGVSQSFFTLDHSPFHPS